MEKYQNILVTGATGFIGQHLVRFLCKQPDIRVYGVSQHGGQVDNMTIDSVNLELNGALNDWLKDKPTFQAIFHLAALIPASADGDDAAATLLPNLFMVQNILSLAVSHQTQVIYASSSSVYGSGTKKPFHESVLPKPDNLYSLSKYIGELLLEVVHIQKKVITCSLRISAPYGPKQRTRTVLNVFLDAALSSKDLIVYGDGTRTQDFTYVDDIVKAMWLAFQLKAIGVYNIASGRAVSMLKLAETILSLLPDTTSKIVTASQPDPQENYRGSFSVEKAYRELGYKPDYSLEKGLQLCLTERMSLI